MTEKPFQPNNGRIGSGESGVLSLIREGSVVLLPVMWDDKPRAAIFAAFETEDYPLDTYPLAILMAEEDWESIKPIQSKGKDPTTPDDAIPRVFGGYDTIRGNQGGGNPSTDNPPDSGGGSV